VAAGAASTDALEGGEDYELVATMPDMVALSEARERMRGSLGTDLSEVGEIVAGDSIVVVEDGAERTLVQTGWDHFG
jgi:thiamine monophosphate kinase